MSPATRRPAAMLLAMIFFVLTGLEGRAMWAQMSEAELVTGSDVIVTGTLARTTVITDSVGHAKNVGVIIVENVLKGDGSRTSLYLSMPQPGGIVSSSEIAYRLGQEGLWFLRRLAPARDAIYAADHPQRFVPRDQAGPIIPRLRRVLKP